MKNRRFGRSVGKPDNAWGNPANVPRLEIDETPVFLPASSYPFTFNLKSRVRNFGANSEINILSVKEVSESGLATPWTQANRFLTMDRRGRITYRPKGTYLNNRLIIEFEAADEQHPATNQATQISQSYEEVIERPWGSGSGSAAPTVGTLAIQIQDDVIGDPEKEKQFWMLQDSPDTCAIAAVASALRSLGIRKNGTLIDYETVLNDVVREVDAQGNRIGEKPPILRWNHRAMYTVQYKSDGSRIVKLDNFSHPGWDVVPMLLKHYGVQTHMGHAKHFSTIVKEIETGNKIIAFIDATETWENDYVSRIQSDTDNLRINGETGTQFYSQNHALWITGINRSDPQNPMIVVNDPGVPDGAAKEYPLEQFLAAWEDSNFLYTGTGSTTPDLTRQDQRRDVENRLTSYLSSENVSQREQEKIINTHYFYEYIRNTGLQNKIETKSPGAKALIVQYLSGLQTEEQRIFTQYNLNPATINSFYSNADVSEWLIQQRLEQGQNGEDDEE